jgi:hypothetical protein
MRVIQASRGKVAASVSECESPTGTNIAAMTLSFVSCRR